MAGNDTPLILFVGTLYSLEQLLPLLRPLFSPSIYLSWTCGDEMQIIPAVLIIVGYELVI